MIKKLMIIENKGTFIGKICHNEKNFILTFAYCYPYWLNNVMIKFSLHMFKYGNLTF